MHFNREKSSLDLKFDVAAPQGWSYAPGDTIIGNLVRHNPVVAHEAEVKIKLIGRIKSKVVRSKGNGTSVNRDEHHIFNLRPELLYQGTLHLPEGSDETLNWPFEIKIPTEPAASTRSNHNAKASFLPLDRDHPAHHVLPGSFSLATNATQCKVEYALKATLKYEFAGSHFHEAMWPINIRFPVPHREGQFEVITRTTQNKIKSQRLVPGLKNAELSFGQGIKNFFGTSSVPEISYQVQLTVPRTIRFRHTQPLPVSLQITELPEWTSSIIKDVPQTFTINSIRLIIRQRTDLRAPDRTGRHYVEQTHDEFLNAGLEKLFTDTISPLTVSTGASNQSIHLGHIFKLTCSEQGLWSGPRLLTQYGKLTPSFSTYCIQQRSVQEWKVSLSVAGEVQVHKFSTALEIIGAS